jgi:ABC-type nitrate/sulfonate/bicarbonate transport system ATPase subunit
VTGAAAAARSFEPAALIEARDLSVTFGATGLAALESVNLTIHVGEIVVLVGPSGCGKTTFLNGVCGLLPATARVSGTLTVAKNVRLGYMPQKDALLPWRTVLGNVEIGPELRGFGRAERRAKAEQLIELVGLSKFRHSYPHELSGGMRQRVSLARTLAYEPDVILMDEPFAALDAFNRTALQEEILRINDKTRLTVLFITHDLSEALVLGRRVVVMSSQPGQIVKIYTVDLPEPRSAAKLRGTDAFLRLFQKLWNVLMEESATAKRAERPQP